MSHILDLLKDKEKTTEEKKLIEKLNNLPAGEKIYLGNSLTEKYWNQHEARMREFSVGTELKGYGVDILSNKACLGFPTWLGGRGILYTKFYWEFVKYYSIQDYPCQAGLYREVEAIVKLYRGEVRKDKVVKVITNNKNEVDINVK